MKRHHRLAVATGAVLAAVAFGSTAALAHGGSGPGDGDESILRAEVIGSQVNDPTLFGVKPGGAPWVIGEGTARLSGNGSLRVAVEGLVIPGRGNPVPRLSASVACGGAVVASTPSVPFDTAGNATIRAVVTLPDRCLAPVVLLNPNEVAGTYIAITGG